MMQQRDTEKEMREIRENYELIRSDLTGRKKPVSMYQIAR